MRIWKVLIMWLVLIVTVDTVYGGEDKNQAVKETPGQVDAQLDEKETDTLVLIARLVDIPGKFAPNDLYNYVYVMKYRIVKIEQGEYPHREILVGHYNPLIPRARIKDRMDQFVEGDVVRFEEGARHRLVLISPMEKVWNDAVEDEFFDSELDRYFALRADIVKQ